MIKYCLRRIMQIPPTLAGVVLITFVLFNVVGGSPAALVLGEHASPKALDEFDRQRGFDLPLFFGRRIKTRIFPDTDFERPPGAWEDMPGAHWDREQGALILPPGIYEIPLRYEREKGGAWEWQLRYRLGPGARAFWLGRELKDGGGTISTRIERREVTPPPKKKEQGEVALPPKKEEQGEVALPPQIEVSGGPLQLEKVSLRRVQDNPFRSQLMAYLGKLIRLDFGVSTNTNQRVARLLKDGIGPSLALMIPIFLGDLILSLFLAMICAYARDTVLDRTLVVGSVALMSINYIVWIVAGQYIFGFRLGWFPVWGFESWRYLLLPVFIGIATGLGAHVRFYRTIVLDEMYRDYVRTAFALGLSRERVLSVHVMKNVMIPVLTNVIVAIPFLYTGSLLLESFFGIPGLGYLSVNAVNSADVAVIRAIVLIGAVLFMAANLLTDICYAAVDPRVRFK